jgi:2-amino-4-hydroxy-6-hydroxymethyldihydropteridine diphosphokinase
VRTVYLSLGSNIGDRQHNLQSAIDKLHGGDLRVKRISSVYETAAVDYTAQADFLNCVVEAETTLFPMRLLLRVERIEREMGRKRHIPKGPRNIDIDILLHGRSVVETNRLHIPHPRMDTRRFVLEPLTELAPDLRHPIHRRTMKEMLAAAPDQRVVRLILRLDVPAR